MSITFTPAATAMIREALAASDELDHLVRIQATRRGVRRFRYAMAVEAPGALPEDHVVVTTGDVRVCLDPQSAEHLQGAVVDYVDGGEHGPSGFRFENPQEKVAWADPVAKRIQALLDEEINPSIAGHRGFIELVEYRDGRAVVHMGGGCHGCGQANATLREGVEIRLREVVPELREVVDATDHARGENPFC